MTLTAPGALQADSTAGGPIPPNPARGLICRNCGATFGLIAEHACAECFGPLEVDYDKDLLRAGFGGMGPPALESAWTEPGAVRVMRRLPPHLPRVGPSSRAGRNWHLPPAKNSRAAVAGASSGRVPLPLWMSGTPSTVPSPSRLPSPGQDVVVSTGIVYTDLDDAE